MYTNLSYFASLLLITLTSCKSGIFPLISPISSVLVAVILAKS